MSRPPKQHILPLDEAFFRRPARLVAGELVGAHLHRLHAGRQLCGRIVEVEAYVGVDDSACHASKGTTKRTEVMFEPGGAMYIYLIYGIHHMLNLVTGAAGSGEAVLIRAVEQLTPEERPLKGPGVLCREWAIDRSLNGAQLGQEGLWFSQRENTPRVVCCPRIGIDYASEPWRSAHLRFCDADSPALSKKVPPSASEWEPME